MTRYRVPKDFDGYALGGKIVKIDRDFMSAAWLYEVGENWEKANLQQTGYLWALKDAGKLEEIKEPMTKAEARQVIADFWLKERALPVLNQRFYFMTARLRIMPNMVTHYSVEEDSWDGLSWVLLWTRFGSTDRSEVEKCAEALNVLYGN